MPARFTRFGVRGFGRPEPPVELQAKRTSKSSAGAFGLTIQMDTEALTVAIGAASLADAVSTALLAHHAASIEAGLRPAGGRQAPLDPEARQGIRAKQGKRPDARGNTGRPSAIPPNLTRGQMDRGRTVSAGKSGRLQVEATARIFPAGRGQGKFIEEEAALGNEFFSVDGSADRVIEDAVIDYMARVFNGTRYYSSEEIKAKEL